ncbi:hypothetical protein CSKR_103673 [Clonorchis sinensis]|uniref:Uncharacterized protein n=1 Tax=Clonorchis sinensis TaxID=79923 RepID=A0A8T1MMD2_CLOSI|nr:hypothetical protein CSKR_103673 [Clonorchis sinensis]
MCSLPTTSVQKFPRRTSVTPAAASYTRPSYESSNKTGRLSLASASSERNSTEASGFNAGEKLRRMSTLFSIDKSKTREAIMAVLEDPARTEYRKLKNTNEHLTAEWKQLRKFVEQLASDYENTRQLDPIRRYRQLQAMTKRTVMHLRLTEVGCLSGDPLKAEVPVQGSVLQSEAKEREIEKRIMRMCENYTVEELGPENRRLRENNDRLETRIQLIVQTINELDVLYRSSKSDSFVKRYGALREAIKEIVTNKELIEAP